MRLEFTVSPAVENMDSTGTQDAEGVKQGTVCNRLQQITVEFSYCWCFTVHEF